MVELVVVQVMELVVVQVVEECWLLVQVVVVRQGHEPEAEPRWGIRGQRVLNRMRGCNKVGMRC